MTDRKITWLPLQIGDEITVKNPASSFHRKTGKITSVGTELCRVRLNNTGEEIHIKRDWLTYSLNQKIAMLQSADHDLVMEIIPGKWVAHNNYGMYFGALGSNASPAFDTKTELIASLSADHQDNRPHKTIIRELPDRYLYTFPDSNNKIGHSYFVIQKVTLDNLNDMRNYCINGLCPEDYEWQRKDDSNA